MRGPAIVVALMVVGCAGAHANAPAVVVPSQPRARERAGATAGRGDVELGLGAITVAVAGVLVGVGSYEAWRGVQVRNYCRGPFPASAADYNAFCTTPLGGDPFVAAVVSSSLSFAFAVPIAVAGGLLLRRGVVNRQAWRRAQENNKMSLRPWPMGQHGAGLSFGLAF